MSGPVMLGTRTIAQDPLGLDEDGRTLTRSGYPGSTLPSVQWQEWLLDNAIERGHQDFRNCYSNIDVPVTGTHANNPAFLTRSNAFEAAGAARGEILYVQIHVNGDTSGSGGSAHNIIWAPDPETGQPAFNNTAQLPGAPGSPKFWAVAPSKGNGNATGYQGNIDAGIIALGTELKALGAPFMFCFQHEPDDDYTGNGYTGSTFRNAGMANWARAFNHWVSVWTANFGAPGSAGFPNLLGYMPTFMQIHMRTLSGGQTTQGGQPTYLDPDAHWRKWYDALDWTTPANIYAVGCDYYINGSDAFSTFEGLGGYTNPTNTTRGAAFVVDEVNRLATVAPTHAHVPPIIFGEVGYSPCGGRYTGAASHRKAEFLRALADYCKTSHGQRIIGLCFQGNLPPENGGAGFWDYDPDDDTDSRLAMQQVWNDPYFGGSGGACPLPLNSTLTPHGRSVAMAVA